MPDEEITPPVDGDDEDDLTAELERLAEPEPEAEEEEGDGDRPAVGEERDDEEEEEDDQGGYRGKYENLRAALREQRRVAAERVAALEGRLDRVIAALEARTTRKRVAPPPPFEEDPEGAVRRVVSEEVGKLGRKVEEKEQLEAVKEQLENRRAEIEDFVRTDREGFLEHEGISEETLAAAEEFYFQKRVDDYRDWNPGMEDEEIAEHIKGEIAEFWIAHHGRGSSVAQTVYKMAQRAGFKAGEPGEKPRKRSKTLDSVRKKMKGGRSLAEAAPTPPRPKAITAKQVAAMTDKEFDKWEREMLAAGADRAELHEDLLRQVGESA